jgi:hypothetical protein
MTPPTTTAPAQCRGSPDRPAEMNVVLTDWAGLTAYACCPVEHHHRIRPPTSSNGPSGKLAAPRSAAASPADQLHQPRLGRPRPHLRGWRSAPRCRSGPWVAAPSPKIRSPDTTGRGPQSLGGGAAVERAGRNRTPDAIPGVVEIASMTKSGSGSSPKGFRSTFAPPDAKPRGTGRNGRGRQATAQAVDRPFVHVTRDGRGRVGMGRDPRGDGGATCKIAGIAYTGSNPVPAT